MGNNVEHLLAKKYCRAEITALTHARTQRTHTTHAPCSSSRKSAPPQSFLVPLPPLVCSRSATPRFAHWWADVVDEREIRRWGGGHHPKQDRASCVQRFRHHHHHHRSYGSSAWTVSRQRLIWLSLSARVPTKLPFDRLRQIFHVAVASPRK